SCRLTDQRDLQVIMKVSERNGLLVPNEKEEAGDGEPDRSLGVGQFPQQGRHREFFACAIRPSPCFADMGRIRKIDRSEYPLVEARRQLTLQKRRVPTQPQILARK